MDLHILCNSETEKGLGHRLAFAIGAGLVVAAIAVALSVLRPARRDRITGSELEPEPEHAYSTTSA
jgi:hypothetical protein